MAEERTSLNAPGPFYVARDQCIACMAPEAEAPSLMAFDEQGFSCYFRRQPETPDETYRAIRAVWVSCCGAVRYGGADPEIIRRLVNIGLSAQVDAPTNGHSRRTLPDRAIFDYGHGASAAEIAAEIGRQMLAAFRYGSVSESDVAKDSASFVWTWAPRVPGASMKLIVCAAEQPGRWMIRLSNPAHPGAPSVATSVDDALRATGRASDLRWYTLEGLEGGRGMGNSLPI